MKALGWYLEKVEAGEPVKMTSFAKVVSKAGIPLSHFDSVFGSDAQSRTNNRKVIILDQAKFDDLKLHYGGQIDTSTRITASKTTDSHRVPVGGSYLITRSIKHPLPQVIVVDGVGGYHCQRKLAREAVIVENLQNHLMLPELTRFVSEMCGYSQVNEAEIIFAAGNGINNKLHTDLLKSFDSTHWLLDVDSGAMTIFNTAIKELGRDRCQLLYPSDTAMRLANYGKPLTDDQRRAVHLLTGKHGQMDCMAELILHSGKWLEQETYLINEAQTP